MKSIDKFVLVLVASLALLLAGCGGGSSSTEPEETGPTPEEMAMERAKTQTTALMTASMGVDTALDGLSGSEPTQAQIDAVNTAIGGLEAAIMDAADVDDAVKAGYQGKVDSAKITAMNADEALMAMEKEANAMEAKEMAALGKALRTALGSDPLGYLAATPATFGDDGKLTINTTGGAVTLPTGVTAPPALEAGDSAGMLSGWMGMDYAKSTGTGNAKVTNEARVYTNQDEPGMIPFDANEKDGKYALISTDGATKGYVMLGVDNTTPDTRAMADAFTHSGTQTHSKPAESDAVYISGSYDGAQGRFRCEMDCSSINDGKGTVTSLEGTWYFKPDAGAMVSQPDANYLYYGWWVNKDEDGEPKAASAFAGLVASNSGPLVSANIATTGSATYKGGAAGKFAMNNALDGTGSGGHFTADAELKATFGDGDDAGVTGTIDNFMLNDGSEDAGWSVALNKGDLSATGMIGGTTVGTTVWSVNGNKASASGTWTGQMYDETSAPSGKDDGSNVPTTAIGEFQSMFGENGSMVGAFGVDLEN